MTRSTETPDRSTPSGDASASARSAGMTVCRTDAEAILPVRAAVLRPGLPLDAARNDRDAAPDAAHFAAYLDGRLVGCVTVYLDPFHGRPAWRVRGMAVADGLRGTGVGRRLIDAVHAHVDAENAAAADRRDTLDGARPLWCNARLVAVGFYERCGWAVESDEFDIPGIGPHHVMARRT